MGGVSFLAGGGVALRTESLSPLCSALSQLGALARPGAPRSLRKSKPRNFQPPPGQAGRGPLRVGVESTGRTTQTADSEVLLDSTNCCAGIRQNAEAAQLGVSGPEFKWQSREWGKHGGGGGAAPFGADDKCTGTRGPRWGLLGPGPRGAWGAARGPGGPSWACGLCSGRAEGQSALHWVGRGSGEVQA